MRDSKAMEHRKRKRVVVWKPNSDYCKTCRKRKVKCDEARPHCQRCLRAGIPCEGYSSWEVAVPDGPDAIHPLHNAAHPHLGNVISGSPLHRAQMLAAFLQDRYPSLEESIGPYAPHTQNSSLLHIYAQLDAYAPPLLQQAMDTICLAHLASKSREPRLVYAASLSQGRLLARLRAAVLAYRPHPPSPSRARNSPFSSAQSIMIAIVLMSITPPIDGESERPQSAVHLQGMLQFLINYGPSFLTGHQDIDTVLIRQLQVQAICLGIASRRNVEFENPEWAQVPRVLLEGDQAIYRKTGFLTSKSAATSQWRQSSFSPVAPAPFTPDRNLARDLIVPVPKLLESADSFSRGCGPHARQALDDIASTIMRAHEVQVHCVQPAIREAAMSTLGPMVSNLDSHRFDRNIEEHVYLLRSPTIIVEHYDFTARQYSFPSMTLRFCGLLTDCAILQVIKCGVERDGLEANWTGINREEVAYRARTTSLQICQHIHYKSQRATVTAARFLRAYILAAKNHFQSVGAEKEAEWCEGCLAATSARIKRLALETNTASLCPMIETLETIGEGCRYKGTGF